MKTAVETGSTMNVFELLMLRKIGGLLSEPVNQANMAACVVPSISGARNAIILCSVFPALLLA